MRRLPYGNCPYCDARGGLAAQGWAMSPDGWAQMREAHEAGHPNKQPLGIKSVENAGLISQHPEFVQRLSINDGSST